MRFALDTQGSALHSGDMTKTKPEPCYQAAKFGTKWGIVYRLNATTAFDQRVRYRTKREAQSMAALLNREGI